MLTLGAVVRRTTKGAAAFGFSTFLAAATLLAAQPAEAHHHSYARHHGRHYASFHSGAFAKHSHSYASRRFARWGHRPHEARAGIAGGSPIFAAIVVDGNSGQILYARNEDEPRHPASITKVMTLYLLFEQIERGRLSLDSELRVSAHAAAQKPTKLGLRPGETITVDDAIKAVVTRSANDMAVAIAEAIGGDEEHFAELMTRKAHALGMTRTVFVNASGLPDDAQITTAHDLTILGRAIQERFPRYYHYFSTHAFYYGGATILNHNHLMDRVEGMDGIKTGYTRASGFNLLTSVKRDGRYIVAAVMGGASAASRDRVMAGLIEDQIERGAKIRTASAVVDISPDLPSRQPGALVDRAMRDNPAATPALAYVEPSAGAPGESSRIALSAIASKAQPPLNPIRVASIAPEAPIAKRQQYSVYGALSRQPSGADAGGKQATVKNEELRNDEALAKRAALDKSTTPSRRLAVAAAPAAVRWIAAPTATKGRKPSEPTIEKLAALHEDAEPVDSIRAEITRRPVAARTGWMIQIGATEDVAKANALLSRAKADGRKTLGAAQPFTEKVQKGGVTLYRARFAGLEAGSAEVACRTLKRTGFSCFATKD